MDSKMKESYKELSKDIAMFLLCLFLGVCSIPFAILGFFFSFALAGVDEGIDLHSKLKSFVLGD